jgi:hypothetical protein
MKFIKNLPSIRRIAFLLEIDLEEKKIIYFMNRLKIKIKIVAHTCIINGIIGLLRQNEYSASALQ